MSVTTPQDEPWARAAPQHRPPAGPTPRNAPRTPAPPHCSCGAAPPGVYTSDGLPGETPGDASASVGAPRRTGAAVAPDEDGTWLDGAAGRLVRPYTVSNGRTRPVMALDLLARLHATGAAPLGYLTPEHRQALALCRTPVSVAEIAGRLRLPLAVTKVLLGDLLDGGSLTVQAPAYYDDPVDRSLLEAVLDGLRRRL